MRASLSLLTVALGATAQPALAQTAPAVSPITIVNTVQVENKVVDAAGKESVTYGDPAVVVPGDRLLITLRYTYTGAQPLPGFRITNPLDASMQYAEAVDSDGLILSVDGGKNWGALADLTVTDQAGTARPATAADVTHVRWTFAQPLPAGANGERRFYAVVR